MKKYDEIVFTDIINHYYDIFLTLKNKMIEIQNQLNNSFIDENHELLLKIKNKLQNDMESIIQIIINILKWWKEYIDEMNELNNIFLQRKANVIVNKYYENAKILLENEL